MTSTGAIEAVAVYTVMVPMRRAFGHARISRSQAESVLVRVTLDGVEGWGEGAPRPYVTNETLDSCVSALTRFDVETLDRLLEWDSFEATVASLARLDLPRLLGGLAAAPAAAAALEIALLDALCRVHQRPLGDVLRLAGVPSQALRLSPSDASVSLVVDLARELDDLLGSLPTQTVRALRHVKVKAATDPEATIARLADVRLRVGYDVQLSLDVNGSWPPQTLKAVAPRLLAFELCWVEEPTTPRAWAAMRWLRTDLGLGVMLDESCVDVADLDLAVACDAASHVNIRVSKCGGVLRAVALLARAERHGLGYQLGVQVGETGPLWAAGRTLATMLADAATIEAGRQDEWFVEALTDPPFSIDRIRYIVAALPGHGIGVKPSRALLRHAHPCATWRSSDEAWELAS